jgi:hypothetical protein
MLNRTRRILRATVVKGLYVYCMDLKVAVTVHNPRTIGTGV